LSSIEPEQFAASIARSMRCEAAPRRGLPQGPEISPIAVDGRSVGFDAVLDFSPGGSVIAHGGSRLISAASKTSAVLTLTWSFIRSGTKKARSIKSNWNDGYEGGPEYNRGVYR
jgi:hypothetical protein